MRSILLILFPILFFCSCGEDDSVTKHEIEDNVRWNLTEVRNGNEKHLFFPEEGVQYYFEKLSNGKVKVKAGCNTCDGELRLLNGEGIEFRIGCTEAACNPLPDGAFYQEYLSMGYSVKQENDELKIYFKNNEDLLCILVHTK